MKREVQSQTRDKQKINHSASHYNFKSRNKRNRGKSELGLRTYGDWWLVIVNITSVKQYGETGSILSIGDRKGLNGVDAIPGFWVIFDLFVSGLSFLHKIWVEFQFFHLIVATLTNLTTPQTIYIHIFIICTH